MSFISDDVCAKVYVFAKRMMDILKETLEAERIYLCTMCDGEVNHFHLQLLPRYPGEVIGSTNFVRERKPYMENKDMVKVIRNKTSYTN